MDIVSVCINQTIAQVDIEKRDVHDDLAGQLHLWIKTMTEFVHSTDGRGLASVHRRGLPLAGAFSHDGRMNYREHNGTP